MNSERVTAIRAMMRDHDSVPGWIRSIEDAVNAILDELEEKEELA